MVSVTVTCILATVLLAGAAIAEKEEVSAIFQEVDKIFAEDDFAKVTTKENAKDDRKKRSATLAGNGCGVTPTQNVNFVRCFDPRSTSVLRSGVVRNYYRQGNYGQCLNYFNSLPLSNVSPVSNGYTGQLIVGSGRTYTVNACRRCYGGYPGIRVAGNSPYNRGIIRQFIFRPQINNINYNTYATGYGTGYNGAGYGSGYVSGVGYGGGYVNGGDYNNGAGYLNGGSAGYVNGGGYSNGVGYVSGAGYLNGGGYINGGGYASGLGDGGNYVNVVGTGNGLASGGLVDGVVGSPGVVGAAGVVGAPGVVGAVGVVGSAATVGCSINC